MANLFGEIKKSVIGGDLEVITSKTDVIDIDLSAFIDIYISELSYGKENDFDTETVLKKICKYFENKEDSMLKGSTSEFLVLCILKKMNYEPAYCYVNLEENSIKKGFDGVYIYDDSYWLMESKSTDRIKSHNYKHNYTLKKCFVDIDQKITGKSSNDPWENALNHIKISGNGGEFIDEISKLSTDYINDVFKETNDFNIVLASTVFCEDIDIVDQNHDNIANYVNNYSANSKKIVALNVSHKEILKEFLRSRV